MKISRHRCWNDKIHKTSNFTRSHVSFFMFCGLLHMVKNKPKRQWCEVMRMLKTHCFPSFCCYCTCYFKKSWLDTNQVTFSWKRLNPFKSSHQETSLSFLAYSSHWSSSVLSTLVVSSSSLFGIRQDKLENQNEIRQKSSFKHLPVTIRWALGYARRLAWCHEDIRVLR